MKKIPSKILMLFFVAVAFSFTASAKYVTVRPVPPVYARPMAPSPRHIWIDGDWAWRGGAYVYTNGYWVEPRPGFIWVTGHWNARRGRWNWVPGRWRRR
jgi:hypothetical protein